MPRKPRFYQAGVPVHAFQRGHNKEAVFFDDEDYLVYLRCLKESSDKYGCHIHAYVLMTNHVHLLLTPEKSDSISLLFQNIGRHFVPYINKTYQRRGSLWEGRHKGNIIDTENYLFACMRYIEMNPVRANMVNHPAKYRWSSYAANSQGIDNAIIHKHPQYQALALTPAEQQQAYQALFDVKTDKEELELIRSSLHSGTPLGSDKFKQQIEISLGRKVGKNTKGRPIGIKKT
ncbi:MAG: transposase [Methylococcaceae bacterium]|nr:transposase [Methylococcaceae bacterium]